MLVQERFEMDGRELIRSFSDAGMLIENEHGERYGEAIDPAECGRAYVETDVLAEEETEGLAKEEATEHDS